MDKEQLQENENLEVEADEEEETSFADDIAKLKAQDEGHEEEEEGDVAEDSESKQEESKKETEGETEEEKAEKERLKKAQEDYKKRQEERRRKQEEQKSQQQNYEKAAEKAVDNADKEALEFVKQLRQQQEMAQLYEGDKKALKGYEEEFAKAYPDYNDKKNTAFEILIEKQVALGKTEEQARSELEYEMILLANQAAVKGLDPVEEIYKEANSIINAMDKYAEKMGYIKPSKKKTNLQALREASKPNAMSGGAGKGATAARKTFDDLEGEEVDELSIGQMLNGDI